MAEIMYVDWDGLVYYDTRSKQYIKDIVDQTIKFGGNYSSIVDVPAPGFETLHVAYKITDKFVVSPETAYFLNTCAGKSFEAGTVLLVVEDNESDTYKFDILFEAYSGTLITPDGELDLSNYYTRTQVDNLLLGKVDTTELDKYYLKTETDEKLADKADRSDLNGLATEEFVATSINAIKIPDEYVTEEELQAKDFATKDDLEDYAKDEDLNTVSLAVEELGKTVTKNTTDIETLDDAVANNTGAVEALRGEVTEVSDKVTDLQEAVNNISIPNNYVTDEELEAKGYITEHQDISHLATKDEIPSIEGLATEQFVTDKISEIDIPETDLSNYYNKTETETLVDDAVKTIIVPEVPTNVSAFTNDANYTTIAEVATQGYLTSIPDEYVTADELAQEGFLKEHQSLEGYVKDAELTDAIEAVEHKIVTKTSELENDAEFVTKSSLPAFVSPDDVADHITLADVEEAGFIKDIPDDYVTDTELNAKGYLTEHQSLDDYAKKSDLPDVSNFATTDQIPSIEGLATETYVDQKVSEVVIPDVSNFVTTETVNTLLETKADNVLFTTNMIVKTPVGGFVADESIQNMTIAQILTKLLGLELYTDPGIPEEPTSITEKIIADETPMYSINSNGELVETSFHLIDGNDAPTESGFYTIEDEEGNIIEAGYQDLQITNDEMYYVIALPKEIDYNTMVDVETYDPDEKIWVDADIALTSDADVVSACCEEVGIDISHIDTDKYTVWVQEDICTGSIIRYKFVEEN